MFLIAGLGNPGPTYEQTRHNLGFLVVDVLARRMGSIPFRKERDGEVLKGSIRGEDLVLVKPSTFMNRSGEAVSRIARFYQIPRERVIAVHDELDIPFGAIRVKVGGGDAGHNGLRSLTQQLGGPGYVRVRAGIGRPTHPAMEVADWVLGSFGPEERRDLDSFVNEAADIVEAFITNGLQKAQQLTGRKGVKREGSGKSEHS
jgi:PTH1 family peptidyl-tRNA hydrolase